MYGFLFVPLLVTVATVQAVRSYDKLNFEWEDFKVKHGKAYDNEVEEKFRKMIFIDNWHMITKHNQKYREGVVSYGMAMNHFGDLLHHERRAATKCLLNRNEVKLNGTRFFAPGKIRVPGNIDWVKKGYVTPVKNQGDCGSCWTFSATGSLEGQHKRKSGKLVSLSEQNLVDCGGKYGAQGCEGGLPEQAYEYIKDNKGIDTEDAYPYEGQDLKCRFKKRDIGATDKGYVSVESGNEDKLKMAVGTMGPVSVGIDASQKSFGFYSEGVYDEPDCSAENLDHAVLIVGYGTYEQTEFWMVKNSWGKAWGIEGFIRMSRNKENQCGIATQASYPIV